MNFMDNNTKFCTSEKLYKDLLVDVIETKKLYSDLLFVPNFLSKGICQFIRSIVSEVDLLDHVTAYMEDYKYVGILKSGNIVFIKELIFLTEDSIDNYYG